MRRFLAGMGLLALLSCPSLALAQTVPPGFTDSQVVAEGVPTGVFSPTAVAYEPGAGHLWMCEKGNGMSPSSPRIRRKDVGTGLVNTALTLTVDSRGERGILGIAFDHAGKLWEVEMGPRGGDELNLVTRGKDYGWPTIGYGEEYSGKPIGKGITAAPGMEQPVYYWDPVIAPSSLMIHSGRMFQPYSFSW